MDRKDVKVGMKVVPHAKTAGNVDFVDSDWYKQFMESQGYLVVTDQWHTDVWGLAPTMDKNKNRQEYSSADFEPYIEK